MLRHLPKFKYTGLTVILSNPSRFDTKILLSGNGGYFFESECLAPEINRYQCDIKLIDDTAPLLPETKVCLLMGEKAQRLFCDVTTTLDENRGSLLWRGNIPCISSFTAQDCMDMKNWEKLYNEAYQEADEYWSDETDSGDVFESKGRGRTKRKNYRFWLKSDTKKALRILENNGRIPSPHFPEPEYIINPSSKELIDVLRTVKNDWLYIDIETDLINPFLIRCIAFCFESKPNKVYVFNVLSCPDYRPAYDNLHHVLRALAMAIHDNTVVAHNGALFDYLVFALGYKIPIGKSAWDTMISASRIYPDIEKSLGHWISLLTYLEYHKNEGVHTYKTAAQCEQLMRYCGKDVYSMMLVKKAQDELANKDPGLKASIQQAQDSIRPYLINTILGIKYDEELRQEWIALNDRLMYQYLRMMRLAHGPDVEDLISNKKCVEYFHNRLGYKVVGRTETGAPSLKEDALLKLKLKHPDNIVIDLLLKYRGLQKESGTLQFKPWIKNETSIVTNTAS